MKDGRERGGPEPVKVLFSVTGRGSGAELAKHLASRGVGYQLRMTGRGTASSEMMDILGLGSSEKDVILSFGPESAVSAAVRDFTDNMGNLRRGQGIMMLISPDAAGSMLAAILTKVGERAEKTAGKEEEAMKNEHRHSLILIAVNQGYTDEVMQTARSC